MFPKILELGPITLHTYGLLLASACLVAIALMSRLAEQEGVPRTRAWDLGFVIILCAIIGAKVLMIFSTPSLYLSHPSRILSIEFLEAGGVFYGGLLGAVVGSVIFARRSRDLDFWTMADAAAPAIALGQSIGRVGCFAAGCDYGKPTTLPWGVTFTSEYSHRFVGVPLHVPLHPSQLYESFSTLLLFFFLLWAYRRRRFRGQTFCLYLASYAVIRFLLEYFRGDVDRGFVVPGVLSTSQFIGLLILPAAIFLYVRLQKVVDERHA